MNQIKDFSTAAILAQWATGSQRIRVLLLCSFLIISSIKSGLGADFLNFLGQPLLNTDQQRLAGNWVSLDIIESYYFVSTNVDLLDEEMLTLNTPAGSFQIYRHKVEMHSEGFYSWFGKNADDHTTFNVVNNKGKITAVFFSPGMQFQIMPMGDGIHFAFIVDGAAATNDDGDLAEVGLPGLQLRPKHPVNNPEAGMEMLAGNCKVRVLICISDDALGVIGDVPGYVQSCIDITNTAYENSNINFEVELARSEIVSYTESADANTDLAYFESTSDGVLDGIHTTRTYYDADLCVLIANNFNDWAGYANSIGGFGYYDAFCVVEWDNAVGTLTFPHELGHLYGARHDLYVDQGDTPYDYGHGYVDLPNLFRTVMAYNDECVDAGTSCTRIPYFSNPAVNYFGDPTGVSGESDNESAHDNSDDNIGSLESSVADKLFPSETIDADETGDVIATNSITNTDLYHVESGGNITWRAGSELILAEGFLAHDGSTFRAYLDECTPLKMSEETDPEIFEAFPDAIATIHCYPNPFDHQTEITMSLSKDALVTAWISDIGGKRVALIAEEQFYKTGEWKWLVSLPELAAGSYFAVVVINQQPHLTKLEKVR